MDKVYIVYSIENVGIYIRAVYTTQSAACAAAKEHSVYCRTSVYVESCEVDISVLPTQELVTEMCRGEVLR